MQHRSEHGTTNGVTHGVSNGHVNGYDSEPAKIAASATKQVMQGLRATAAAFTPSKPVSTSVTPTVASVGDC